MKRTLVIACESLLAIGFAVGAARSPHRSETAASAASAAVASSATHVAAADDVPFKRNDTLLFYERREIVDGDTLTDKIFVDSDRASANRRRLRERASLSSAENSRDFAATVRYLHRKHPGPFPRHDLKGIPATWLPLVSVQGTLYIDELDFYPVHLTDSLFVRHTQDGPWPSVYTRFEMPEAGHIRFRANSAYPPEKDRTYDFYLVDPLRRIAVLAEHLPDSQTRYRLLAAEEAAADFDLLVWDFAEIPGGNEIARDTLDYCEMIGEHNSEQP